jgi:hypothetical protein
MVIWEAPNIKHLPNEDVAVTEAVTSNTDYPQGFRWQMFMVAIGVRYPQCSPVIPKPGGPEYNDCNGPVIVGRS